MELRAYLKKNKIKQIELSRATGISASVISSLCNGRKFYSVEVCKTISKWTKGKVSVEELRPSAPVYRLCPTCGKRERVKEC